MVKRVSRQPIKTDVQNIVDLSFEKQDRSNTTQIKFKPGAASLGIEALHLLLSENNLDVPVTWNTDKPVRNADGSQWFVGKHDAETGEMIAHFGDFKRGLEMHWSSVDQGEMSDEERRKYKERMKANAELARDLREKMWTETAITAADEWDQFSELGSTPYMERKGICSLYGCRIMPNEKGDPVLVVPMRTVDGQFWSYQRVYSQKLSAGSKFFRQGGRVEGCFHYLADSNEGITDGDTIYIAEGFATAASIAGAIYPSNRGDSNSPRARVVSAFDSGNLEPVARALRGAFANSRIILCADNDAYVTFKQKDGTNKQYNVGIEKAKRAASAINGELRWPTFKNPDKALTDFNDLATVQGLDEVRRQIIEPTQTEIETQQKLVKEKKVRGPSYPTEKQIADDLIKEFDGKMIRTDKEVFGYNGTHWVEFRDGALDRLKQRINELCSNQLNSREMASYLKTVITYLPMVPVGVDMFSPNPFAANFKNGTLHFMKDGYEKYRLDFRPHARTDYLTSTLPFDFPGFEKLANPPPTPLFDEWLKTVFHEEHFQETVAAYEELGGVGIVQCFPIIALCQGKTRSGKSTAIKLIVKMLSKENTSSVQPADWSGFKMEPMLGKLVNYDLDLDTKKPIQDTVAKKVFDRAQFMVQRKGIRNIFAPLPAVHYFACNELPPTSDVTKNVYQHRILILTFNKYEAPADAGQDFDEYLWAMESEGIVCRFLNGAIRLTQNKGRFTKPASSRDAIQSMERRADPVQRFLEDVRQGEIFDKNSVVEFGPGRRIERKLLWEIFLQWEESETRNQGARLQRSIFYSRIESSGCRVVTVQGVRFFDGLGIGASVESVA